MENREALMAVANVLKAKAISFSYSTSLGTLSFEFRDRDRAAALEAVKAAKDLKQFEIFLYGDGFPKPSVRL